MKNYKWYKSSTIGDLQRIDQQESWLAMSSGDEEIIQDEIESARRELEPEYFKKEKNVSIHVNF